MIKVNVLYISPRCRIVHSEHVVFLVFFDDLFSRASILCGKCTIYAVLHDVIVLVQNRQLVCHA